MLKSVNITGMDRVKILLFRGQHSVNIIVMDRATILLIYRVIDLQYNSNV